MNRKLATIQVIKDLKPIPKADKIEVATIKGWRVVVKKGEFQIGDKCIFFEIDSILPPLECFKFLETSGYRLRSVQMRGQLSQGLAMPLHIIDEFPKLMRVPCFEADPENANALIDSEREYIITSNFENMPPEFEHTQLDFESGGYCIKIEEGLNLTDILGIQKYEPEPVDLAHGLIGMPFPSMHVHHTDLERIQNKPEIIEELQGVECYALQKIDGESFTAILDLDNNELMICSSGTLITIDPETPNADTAWMKHHHLVMAREHNVLDKLHTLAEYISGRHGEVPHSVSVQCELAGTGIHKNRLGLNNKTLFLFNVAFLSDNIHYFDYEDLITASLIGFEMPKEVWRGVFNFKTVEELLELADSMTYPNGHRQEGIVVKPVKEMYSETLSGRMQIKVINNNYLLQIGE